MFSLLNKFLFIIYDKLPNVTDDILRKFKLPHDTDASTLQTGLNEYYRATTSLSLVQDDNTKV